MKPLNLHLVFWTSVVSTVLLTAVVISSVVYAAMPVSPSGPTVILTVNGSDTGVISRNNTEVLFEWYVSDVSSCQLSPGIGTIPVDPATGSMTVTPPADTETTYVLSCDGGAATDTVEVVLEPVTSISLDVVEVPLDPVLNQASFAPRLTWSSTNADYCTQFQVIRHSDGHIVQFAGDQQAPAGERTIREDRFTEVGKYDVRVRCVNQFSGKSHTTSQWLYIVPAETSEMRMGLSIHAGHTIDWNGMLPTLAAAPWANRTANGCKNWDWSCACEESVCQYEYESVEGRDSAFIPHGTAFRLLRENASECEFSWITPPPLYNDNDMVVGEFTCRQIVDGTTVEEQTIRQELLWRETDIDPTEIPVIAKLTAPKEVTLDALTGEVSYQVNYNRDNGDGCLLWETFAGERTELETRASGFGNNRRTHKQAGEYIYELQCFRDLVNGDRMLSEIVTETTTIQPAPEIPDPTITTYTTERISSDGATVSEYEFIWEAENVTSCTFSGVRTDDGSSLVLSQLAANQAIAGTLVQPFVSEGAAVEITLACARQADGAVIEETQTFTVPDVTTAESETTAEVDVTTGECTVAGETHSPPPLGYRATEGTEIGPCLRNIPDIRPQSVAAVQSQDWNYDWSAGEVDDMVLRYRFRNNADNGYLFAGEQAGYRLEIAYNTTDSSGPFITLRDGESVTGLLQPGDSAQREFTVSGVPFGNHLVRLSVDANAGVDGAAENWVSVDFPLSLEFVETDIDLAIEPTIVRANNPVRIGWTISAPYPVSCQISGLGIQENFHTDWFTVVDADATLTAEAVRTGEDRIEINPRSSGDIRIQCREEVSGSQQIVGTLTERIEIVPVPIER